MKRTIERAFLKMIRRERWDHGFDVAEHDEMVNGRKVDEEAKQFFDERT